MIEEYLGGEVYVIAPGDEMTSDNVRIARTWTELQTAMKKLDLLLESECRVFNGFITPATYLPSSFKGKVPFIIVFNENDPEEGMVIESTSYTPEEMATEITEVVRTLGGTAMPFNVRINNIFILYGYQLKPCLSVDEEDIDEEILSCCEDIAKSATEVGKGIADGNLVEMADAYRYEGV